VVTAALFLSCGRVASPPRNLVVILIDTLRSDELGIMGSPIPTSPYLDRIAARGAFVERCYTVSPWTLPTIATLHTGLYPSNHGAIGPRRALSPEAVTLAEMLSEKGYSTGGVVSQYFLRERYGLHQGFEKYSFEEVKFLGGAMGAFDTNYISSEGVTRRAREMLREFAAGPKPFYLFVHYYDPHSDYMRHPQFALAQGDGGRIRGGEKQAELREISESMEPFELEFLRGIYREEIRWTDLHVGRLLSTLAELGVGDETLVLITSDHGEEFQSRGKHIGHCIELYDEDIRVPLIILDPRAKGRVLRGPVSLVDVPPTLLDLMHVEVAGTSFQGKSFASDLLGKKEKSHLPIFCETDFVPTDEERKENESHRRAIVNDPWKIIRNLQTGEVELYDLAADPAERVDLSKIRTDVLAQHGSDLDQWMTQIAKNGLEVREIEIRQRSLEQLRALGYAGR
jgi:arylsulfatase A-like enzyme